MALTCQHWHNAINPRRVIGNDQIPQFYRDKAQFDDYISYFVGYGTNETVLEFLCEAKWRIGKDNRYFLIGAIAGKNRQFIQIFRFRSEPNTQYSFKSTIKAVF